MEHSVHRDIVNILRQSDHWFEEFIHEAVRTSEEAAKLRPGYSLQQGAKAIIVRAKIPNEGKKFLMLVIPADQKFDSVKVKKVINARDLRFATEAEVEEITRGVKPGGVPPFGNLFSLEVISDPSLYQNEKIIFNAGRTTSIGMMSANYKQLVSPLVANIV